MRIGTRIPFLAATLACALATAGCQEDPVAECDLDAAIVPGCGVLVADTEVRLGSAREDVRSAIDTPDTALIFPRVGASDTFGAVGLNVLYAESSPHPAGALIALASFGGATAEGLGIGSARTDVEAAYGSPSVDPFLGSSWYLDRGIGFEFEGDSVSRIHVIPVEDIGGE